MSDIKISGENVLDLPKDLYIPPEAMRVLLEEIFEGPFDLLLYLIRKQNIDILEINVFEITQQYLDYIELMRIVKLELISDYLEMAAILAEIKSRMLLPKIKPEGAEDDELDPKAELIRKLQEYEQIKTAAENLSKAPRLERDIFLASAKLAPDAHLDKPKPLPDIEVADLVAAFKAVMLRLDLDTSHQVASEALSVRDKMSLILSRLTDDCFVDFYSFFNPSEGRAGVIVCFLAILEMAKDRILEIVQSESFENIYVRVAQC